MCTSDIGVLSEAMGSSMIDLSSDAAGNSCWLKRPADHANMLFTIQDPRSALEPHNMFRLRWVNSDQCNAELNPVYFVVVSTPIEHATNEQDVLADVLAGGVAMSGGFAPWSPHIDHEAIQHGAFVEGFKMAPGHMLTMPTGAAEPAAEVNASNAAGGGLAVAVGFLPAQR